MTRIHNAATAADAHSTAPSFGERLRQSIADAVAAFRAGLADRRMREKLAELPDSILLDIGIAEEEIYRVRARDRFTPRAWADYTGSGRRFRA